MAGRGPAPKDSEKRARANSDPVTLRVVPVLPVRQPELPELWISNTQLVWPNQTQEWWRVWGESPLSANFTDSDWSFLLDTAILHAQLWSGDSKVAGELRLRVAKFGATPEDRQRLRIKFAVPDGEEYEKPKSGSSSRDRRGVFSAIEA